MYKTRILVFERGFRSDIYSQRSKVRVELRLDKALAPPHEVPFLPFSSAVACPLISSYQKKDVYASYESTRSGSNLVGGSSLSLLTGVRRSAGATRKDYNGDRQFGTSNDLRDAADGKARKRCWGCAWLHVPIWYQLGFLPLLWAGGPTASPHLGPAESSVSDVSQLAHPGAIRRRLWDGSKRHR
jgi:hypothetical protein